MLNPSDRCHYAASVSTFLKTPKADWLSQMTSKASDLPNSELQVMAWSDCYDVLAQALPAIRIKHSGLSIIFEYQLPYEAGRRPDVVLLSQGCVAILEFKMKQQALRADVDQVSAYARDIREYHFVSRTMKVLPCLVVTRMKDVLMQQGNVQVCSPDRLPTMLSRIFGETSAPCDASVWMKSKYEPLPTIVEAARMLMAHAELPNIRMVNSAGIPEALTCLHGIAEYAQDKKRHMLALVTGVPGAGKTYLGLQYVYSAGTTASGVHSIYLSGNGPLVKVLSSALNSDVFVKDLHKQIHEYLQFGASDFQDNIIVFDEGQRAWDRQQMISKRQGVSFSEPELMIRLAEDRLEWCVLLVLIGEGQEIHKGENSGIGQWNAALANTKYPWDVVGPAKLGHVFPPRVQLQRYIARDKLDLTVSLRNHLSRDASIFVNHIISGDIGEAKELSNELKRSGLTLLITRNIDTAKEYCTNRYEGQLSKRYGLLVSSKASTALMKRYGVDNSYDATSMKNMDIAAWYNDDPRSKASCCSLQKVATEFSCQGLELDMPILCWGTDMTWNGHSWNLYRPSEPAESEENSYRINSYRVLLTRGRDGVVIFVPPVQELDQVYGLFESLGMEPI